MDTIKRHVAYKILIEDLTKGKFIKQEGWEPSFIYIDEIKLKVSRVNLMGVVVSDANKESGFKEMAIDDGSASVILRSFNEELSFKGINIGDMLNVIGRPREFEGSLYIVPEVVKKYENKKIKGLWEFERKRQILPKEDLKMPKKEVKKKILDESNPKQIIYELIKEMDNGDGVEINELISKASIKDKGRNKL
jgi:RPA family protein